MAAKKLKLDPKSMKKLVDSRSTCAATHRVVVEGTKVGWMRRYKRDNALDSGWRFAAGDEDGNYFDDSKNWEHLTINEMANYDPDIIPFLSEGTGSILRRDEKTGEIAPSDD